MMTKLKNILLLVMIAAMVMGLFAGCESEADKIAVLAGTWSMVGEDPEEEATELLENIDLYEEELALVDLTALRYVQIVEFTAEKTYRYAFDVEGTKACVREYFTGVFAALYEGRATLNETYSQTFDQMSEEEFQQFYAELYGASDFAALIDEMTEGAYDYEAMAEAWETGTYSIRGDAIFCTVTGESEAASMAYTIDGDTLTLTYADAVEVYTRAN